MYTILKTFLLCCTSLLVSMAFAQEKTAIDQNKKHEISIGVADLFTKQQPVYNYPWYYYDTPMYSSYLPYYYQSYDQDYTPKLALRYKYNFGKIAIRTGVDFAYQTNNYDYPNNDLENTNTKMQSSFKLGAELHSNFGRVQLYYGVDGLYSFFKNEQVNEYENSVWNGNEYVFEVFKSENTVTYREYGFSPFIGIKYFLNNHLSIGAETNYHVGFYELENKNKYEGETNKNKTDGIDAHFGPIGIISLNVHF